MLRSKLFARISGSSQAKPGTYLFKIRWSTYPRLQRYTLSSWFEEPRLNLEKAEVNTRIGRCSQMSGQANSSSIHNLNLPLLELAMHRYSGELNLHLHDSCKLIVSLHRNSTDVLPPAELLSVEIPLTFLQYQYRWKLFSHSFKTWN